MSKTLKQLHEDKMSKNKLIVDDILVLESKLLLIKEAIDEQTLQKVGQIIDKLKKVKSTAMPEMNNAISKAEDAINRYTGGGLITKALTKLSDVVGIDNPIVKVSTFANALEQGFSQFPRILKNNSIDLQELDNDKLEDTILNIVNSSNEIKNKERTIKNIVNQMQLALAPKGIYSIFKKVPFIKSETLVQELINIPVKTFLMISKTISSGTKTTDVTDKIDDVVSKSGDVETKSTLKNKESKPTSSTELTTGTSSATGTRSTTPTGESPSRDNVTQKKLAYQAFLTAKKANLGIDDKQLAQIIKVLAKNNHIK